MRDTKGKDVGGREATLTNGKPHCIVLDDKQRETIKFQKGDSSLSEFVRDCIDLRFSSKGVEEEEVKELKEKVLIQAKQLKQYKRSEQKATERHEKHVGKIMDSFAVYLETPKDERSISNWVHMRTQNTGVKAEEIYARAEAKGLLK